MLVGSKQFMYNASTLSLVTEISDLEANRLLRRGQELPLSLVVLSDKTGEEMSFTHLHVHRDDEGDVQYWEYNLDRNSQRKRPDLAGLKVVIFND